MNRDQFREYITAFNADDWDGFSRFYAEDVLLDLGGKKQIRGRQGIVDFYKEVKAKIVETLVINKIVMDDEGLAADISTEFRALEDWPDFIAGEIKKGESIHIRSFIIYDINPAGQFQTIRSTRAPLGGV